MSIGRAVATAVLSVVEGLAQERAVVVAIDDVQWLDPPSARVVEFCARRLAGRVGLIASRRAGAEGAWVKALTRLRERDRERVHAVAGFDIGDLARVLDERAERRLERRVLARVHEVSGGNPFYALELARAAPADGPLPPALPLPASLEEIVATRMAGLGEEVEGVLLAVAALADPSVELLERALGPAVAEMLDEAEARGMIELDGQRVRFTHPLLSNGVYARAPSGRRRAMHRRLSAAVADHEERARHLALAGAGPEALAALDEAAREVRVRGAPDAAAELSSLRSSSEATRSSAYELPSTTSTPVTHSERRRCSRKRSRRSQPARPAPRRFSCSARLATTTTASPRLGLCSSRRGPRRARTTACS